MPVFVLHNYCKLKNHAADPELVKIKTEKHKQDQLTYANKETLFSENLDEGETIRDVLLFSVKSVIDNQILKRDINNKSIKGTKYLCYD